MDILGWKIQSICVNGERKLFLDFEKSVNDFWVFNRKFEHCSVGSWRNLFFFLEPILRNPLKFKFNIFSIKTVSKNNFSNRYPTTKKKNFLLDIFIFSQLRWLSLWHLLILIFSSKRLSKTKEKTAADKCLF